MARDIARHYLYSDVYYSLIKSLVTRQKKRSFPLCLFFFEKLPSLPTTTSLTTVVLVTGLGLTSTSRRWRPLRNSAFFALLFIVFLCSLLWSSVFKGRDTVVLVVAAGHRCSLKLNFFLREFETELNPHSNQPKRRRVLWISNLYY